MGKNKIVPKIIKWLQSSEMFARPSKQIPGKWRLDEYYFETKDGLNHLPEPKLRESGQSWNIDFSPENRLNHVCSLPLPLLQNLTDCNWRIYRQFLYIIPASQETIKFQYAIDKEQLRLLKKNVTGQIEFFGFFNRII